MCCVGCVFVRQKLAGGGLSIKFLNQFKKKKLFLFYFIFVSFVFSAVSLYHQRVFSLAAYLHNQHNVSCFSCDLPVCLPVVESFFKLRLPKTERDGNPKRGSLFFFSIIHQKIELDRDGKGGQLVIMLSNAPLAIGSISSMYIFFVIQL